MRDTALIRALLENAHIKYRIKWREQHWHHFLSINTSLKNKAITGHQTLCEWGLFLLDILSEQQPNDYYYHPTTFITALTRCLLLLCGLLLLCYGQQVFFIGALIFGCCFFVKNLCESIEAAAVQAENWLNMKNGTTVDSSLESDVDYLFSFFKTQEAHCLTAIESLEQAQEAWRFLQSREEAPFNNNNLPAHLKFLAGALEKLWAHDWQSHFDLFKEAAQQAFPQHNIESQQQWAHTFSCYADYRKQGTEQSFLKQLEGTAGTLPLLKDQLYWVYILPSEQDDSCLQKTRWQKHLLQLLKEEASFINGSEYSDSKSCQLWLDWLTDRMNGLKSEVPKDDSYFHHDDFAIWDDYHTDHRLITIYQEELQLKAPLSPKIRSRSF